MFCVLHFIKHLLQHFFGDGEMRVVGKRIGVSERQIIAHRKGAKPCAPTPTHILASTFLRQLFQHSCQNFKHLIDMLFLNHQRWRQGNNISCGADE